MPVQSAVGARGEPPDDPHRGQLRDPRRRAARSPHHEPRAGRRQDHGQHESRDHARPGWAARAPPGCRLQELEAPRALRAGDGRDGPQHDARLGRDDPRYGPGDEAPEPRHPSRGARAAEPCRAPRVGRDARAPRGSALGLRLGRHRRAAHGGRRPVDPSHVPPLLRPRRAFLLDDEGGRPPRERDARAHAGEEPRVRGQPPRCAGRRRRERPLQAEEPGAPEGRRDGRPRHGPRFRHHRGPLRLRCGGTLPRRLAREQGHLQRHRPRVGAAAPAPLPEPGRRGRVRRVGQGLGG